MVPNTLDYADLRRFWGRNIARGDAEINMLGYIEGLLGDYGMAGLTRFQD